MGYLWYILHMEKIVSRHMERIVCTFIAKQMYV
jgi:hypothetical protein